MSPSPQSVLVRLALAALVATGACDPEPEAEPSTEAEDRLVYENTHKTLATVPLLAYVAELFAADISWKSLSPDIGARVAVAVTQARLDVVLGSFQCERSFESDGET
ncbi:MAG: hypothetical protein AAF721_27305, partial [Myxococcota bacterium]